MGTLRLSFLGAILIALAISSSLTAGEVLLERRPYTAFDAMVEGAINGEDRRLSLVASQIDTVDRLRSVTVPVQLRRGVYARDPSVAAVYPYGRAGLLGRRPAGYVVIRRVPAMVYQQRQVIEPPPVPYAPGDDYGYSARTAARQPIGHFSGQTGPNRWEYRPLYGDDAEIDVEHAEVESNNLVESDDSRPAAPTTNQRPVERQPAAHQPAERQPAASEPEELPPPRESGDRRTAVRRASNVGAARDIARDESKLDEQRAVEDEQRPPRLRKPAKIPPPPPQPDPELQPQEGGGSDGPMLHDPATGTREF